MNSDAAEEIKRHFDVVADSLRTEMKVLGGDLRVEMEGLGGELRAEMKGLGGDLRAEIRDVKRHSDVAAESLRSEIRLVAEGVAGLDEKFTAEFVNVRLEIREQIDDVKALLRASYDDRVRGDRNPS